MNSNGLPVWAEIRLEALAWNLAQQKKALGGVGLMAVVKADGYGHGMEICAAELRRQGVEWFGVTGAEEGVRARVAVGPEGRILLMRGVASAAACDAVIAHGLTPVVWTGQQVEWMAAAARRRGVQAAVHVEMDTGMTRQGVPMREAAGMLGRLAESGMLRVEGVATHFASSEDVGAVQNAEQLWEWALALEEVRKAGLRPEWAHAGSTSTVDAGEALPELARLAASVGAKPMSRTGLGLYGYALAVEGGRSQVRGGLRPVMALKTRVLDVYEVEKGARVGYNGTFVAERGMRLALLAIGYADGLRRELSNVGEVLIRGKRARIVGRVSMDVTVVDVTGIAEAAVGDEAVILGEQGTERITADDHARIAGTIAYEILCGVSERVPRLVS